ncbi:MAG: hypothetical protein HY748_13035 [Elusimicrobia bacterium]|nr:hypothetical protein [Elusimicrobiota bacterium]
MEDDQVWEATKSLGADALGVMGKGVEIVFSPFQTLLYDILGLFHLATGACIKFFDKHNEFASFEQISAFYTLAQAKFNSWMISGLMKEGQDPVVQQYRAALRSYFADSSNRSLLDAFLDGEVEKMRRRRYGELYRFHEDDPYTEADRAYMAAGIFGYANLAAQYFAEGKESWQQGGWRNKLAALPSYAAGGFVIAGEAYVEGLGFGLAAAPLKLGAAGARAGLSTKQVALAMQASKGGKNLAALSKAEQSAVKLLNNINRAELAAFLAPAGIHTGVSAIQWIDAAFINKDPEKAWAHFDAFFSGAAGFGAMGIGLLQARVTSFAARANAGKLKAPLAETKVAFDPVAAEKVVADLKAQGKPDAAKLVESILTTDARSGMPNRAFLEKNAPELLSKAKDPAVAIMDMNNLGAIQDGLIKALGDPVKGKLMTDQIIGKTGELINSIAAEHGVTVGRLSAGGEEFAVLGSKAQVAKFLERVQLESADGRVLKEAGTWAQGPGPDGPALGAKYKTVMQSIQDTVIAKRGQNQPTGDFTFGVAEVTKGRDLHATLKAADLALTKAKDSGLRGSGLIEVPGKGFEPFKPSGEAKAGPLTPVEVEPLSQSLSRLKGMMSEGEFQQFLSVFAKDFTGARTHEFVAVLEIQGVGSKGGDIAVTSSRDFKILNDAAGHEAGDAFLAAKQKLLAETVAKARAEGLDVSPEVVRLGAKEFALFGKDAGLVMTEFSKSWNQAVSEGKVISQADWAKIKEYAGSHPEISEATLAGIGKQRVVTRKLRADEPLASGAEMAMGDLEILKAAEKPFGLGKLLGKPAKINPNEAPENVRALTRQNETAQTLYKNGYVVEQRGAAEGADFKLNGTEFDCYSPATGNERNIWGVVKDKIIQKKQGRGVVLNLDDSAVSLEALRSQFSRFAIEGLESVLVVKNGEIVPLMKGGKVLAKGDPVLSLGGKPYMADKPELVASAEAKVYLEEAWKAAEARLKEIDAIRAQKGLKPLTEAQSSDILLTRLYRELNPEKGAKGRKRGKGGIVILDNDAGLKGMDPKMAERLKVVMDHHGPYFDAKNAEVDATMRLLSFIDEVMLDPGPTEAKIQYLRQRFGKYSTNNLGDGAWAAWIVDNISLVARDPALRGRIRQATWFEDFGFFGNKAKETAKGDPALGEAIELQQSVFDIYDQALRKHGVKGVDRFDSMPAETQKVLMQEVMAEMSKVVADPKTRGARAGRFRSALEAAQKQVEAARIDLSGAKSQLKNEGFSGKALDDMFVFSADKISAEGGVFANWGGPSQAHDMPLQLSFKSLAADPMGNGRTQFILAVPNGKAAATLKPLGEAISKANLEKAKSLGVGPQEAGMVMGRDALQFAFPPGILLTPTEILLEIGRFRSKVPQN